jgi:diguanylate cyclase (GGDEF)-like protein
MRSCRNPAQLVAIGAEDNKVASCNFNPVYSRLPTTDSLAVLESFSSQSADEEGGTATSEGASAVMRGAGSAAQAALLNVALEHLPHGMCMFDGGDRLVLANRRYQTLWNLPESVIRPGTPFAAIMAETRGVETEASRRQPQQPPGSTGTRRREWQLDDGTLIEVTVTRLADGSCVALHENVTEQRRAQAQVTFLATHDALTGLPNRGALRDELQHLLARNKRGEDLAVLCLDLDRFKDVNDLLGHPAGDALLRQVAERLRQCARETDFVVRLGGDEFAVLQCGAPQPSSSTTLARRIIAALSTPFDLDGHRAHIGGSVGIAIAPFDGEEPEQLLKSADLALYRAKADGRGILRYFEPAMDAQIQARRALEADLRRAMDLKQFHLAYQPQVDTESGTVTAFEALLRWQHPVRGAVSPVEFIPLAEETGLIVAIGSWVLSQACRDAATWPAAVGLAVNVSAVQFAKGSLLADVMNALGDAGLEPGRLELEITESVVMHDAEHALLMLRELRQRGLRVAMDDFGTGYSSLSYLRSFPFDRIKIDRSFIRDIETNAEAQAIVRAVAGLGRSLGMAITVEGVETMGQLAAVRREGCRDVQGYLFSRPRPAADVARMIEAAARHDLPAATSLPERLGHA